MDQLEQALLMSADPSYAEAVQLLRTEHILEEDQVNFLIQR